MLLLFSYLFIEKICKTTIFLNDIFENTFKLLTLLIFARLLIISMNQFQQQEQSLLFVDQGFDPSSILCLLISETYLWYNDYEGPWHFFGIVGDYGFLSQLTFYDCYDDNVCLGIPFVFCYEDILLFQQIIMEKYFKIQLYSSSKISFNVFFYHMLIFNVDSMNLKVLFLSTIICQDIFMFEFCSLANNFDSKLGFLLIIQQSYQKICFCYSLPISELLKIQIVSQKFAADVSKSKSKNSCQYVQLLFLINCEYVNDKKCAISKQYLMKPIIFEQKHTRFRVFTMIVWNSQFIGKNNYQLIVFRQNNFIKFYKQYSFINKVKMQFQNLGFLQLSNVLPKDTKKQVKSLRKYHKSIGHQQTNEKYKQSLLKSKQQSYSQNVRLRNKRIITENSFYSFQGHEAILYQQEKNQNGHQNATKKSMIQSNQYKSINNLKNRQHYFTADHYIENIKKLQKKAQLGARYRNKYMQKQQLKNYKTAFKISKQFKENYQLLTSHHESCILKHSAHKQKKKYSEEQQNLQLISGAINTLITPHSISIEVELNETIKQLQRQLAVKDSIIKNQQQLISHYKSQISIYQDHNQQDPSLTQIEQQRLPSVSEYQFKSQPSKQISETTQYLLQRLVVLQQQLCSFRKQKIQLQKKIALMTKTKNCQLETIRKKSAKQIEKWRQMYFFLRTEMKENLIKKQYDT